MDSFLEADIKHKDSVRLIGRLVATERVINENLRLPKANRVSFEFDAINARLAPDDALAAIEGRGDPSQIALVKILTTEEKFRLLSGVDEVNDGQWYQITLCSRPATGPLAWASSLGSLGYEERAGFVVDEIRWLFSEEEAPLSPVGASVDPERDLAQKIAGACHFPANANFESKAVTKLFRRIDRPYRIVVRDVGQASFCSAVDERGRELFHLDAGWPLPFNKKTAFTKPTINSRDAPVILSHWDWDHLHGYYAIEGLAGGTWIAPIQRLGPGAKLVAHKLAADNRLIGVSSSISAKFLRFGVCQGAPGNLNQTGLWVRLTLKSNRSILFVGDADYDRVPRSMARYSSFLVATHHGATFTGDVVCPEYWDYRCRCVVSVGKGNGYGHPSHLAIEAHKNMGWSMEYTCEWHMASRGNRYLGP